MDNDNRLTDTESVERYISEASYPINRSNLLQYAEDQGASREAMNILRKIPDMEYESPDDVQMSLRNTN